MKKRRRGEGCGESASNENGMARGIGIGEEKRKEKSERTYLRISRTSVKKASSTPSRVLAEVSRYGRPSLSATDESESQ